jgi:hypothetical protein
MELHAGITGFGRPGAELAPDSNLYWFQSHCFAAARMLGGRVLQPAHRPDVVANFVSAVLELPDTTVAILLNLHFPVLGFARPWLESIDELKFVDCQPLADAFASIGAPYEVVSRSELEKPIRQKDLGPLAAIEMDQIRYWKPARVGDVVFNCWD